MLELDSQDDVTALDAVLDSHSLDALADRPKPQREPSLALLAELEAARGDLSVTLVLSTTPNSQLSPEDGDRLEHLRLTALSQLPLDQDGVGSIATHFSAGLNRMVAQAASIGPVGHGIAIFVNHDIECVVSLRDEVEQDRAVVSSSFDTSDLVRTLRRTPRHVVLCLSSREARLLDGAGGRLTPAAGDRFPIDLNALRARHPHSPLRYVDQALGAYLRLHPAPLIVAGPRWLVSGFRAVSEHTNRLAGTVMSSAGDGFDPDELADKTRPVVERYLRSREPAALAYLDEQEARGNLVTGIADTWAAARTEHVGMLAVEQGFWYPARLSQDEKTINPAPDLGAADVIPNLVDELVERVVGRGGWVALVRDGALSSRGRVAITVRPGDA